MGGRRLLSRNGTLAASLLTVVAVAVPSSAWFVAGSRQMEREAELKDKSVFSHAYKKAVMEAERLATRLEVLRETESQRPFYHYQNLFHDPKGASEGVSVSTSPLAQGPADPLIEAHFQVDADGRLTLPTVNDQFPELSFQPAYRDQCALLAKLEDVAIFCSGDLVRASEGSYRPRGGAAVNGDGDGGGRRVEVLDARAWEQQLQANAVYADLVYRKEHPGSRRRLALATTDGVAGGKVGIEVGPLLWHTLPVGGEPSLVALRAVDTPAGLWSQGFVVSNEAVAEYLKDSSYPAVFAPSTELQYGGSRQSVAVEVEGTPWGVAFDVSRGLADAGAEIAAERGRFHRTLLLSLLAAAGAGLLVVGMVFQSERLAAQRAQFAASAAHELRTPLAGLRLYAEMLAEGLGNPRRAREYASRLAAEAERLGRVVTNVLSFTHVERKTLSVHPEPGDLGEAVADAFARHRAALEEAGASVELAIPEGLPAARFDRDAVAHIVQNLLDNAEKYTRTVADRHIRVALEESARGVVLSVADNGPGIPRHLRRRLFRPFTRGRHPEAAEGLGLGLVLVKALAAAQEAEIHYHDAPGGGAVFSVVFPR